MNITLTGSSQPDCAQEQRHTASHAKVSVQKDSVVVLLYR